MKPSSIFSKKKGYLFFLTVSLFLLFFLAVASLRENTFPHETNQLNHLFHLDQQFRFFEQDLSRGLYITSYRSLLALVDWINTNGSYLSNARQAFSEVMMNGTYQGITLPLMEGATFPSYIAKLQENAKAQGFVLSINLTALSLYQDDPWHLIAEANLSLFFAEQQNTTQSFWERKFSVKRFIPLEEIEDPLYTIETHGLVINQIFKTPFTSFVINNDTTNLKIHLNHSWYKSSPTAPSFLQRMEGKNTPSPFGIESLVNLDTLRAQGLPIKNTSVVDYLYFSEKPLFNVSHVQTMPSWFYLDGDDDHYRAYNVTGLLD